MKWTAVLISLFIVVTSCADKATINQEDSFFDISVFVDSLLNDNASYVDVNRTIKMAGEKEEKELSSADLKNVFEFMKQFNINHPRKYDKYTVSKSPDKISYVTKEDHFEIKNCTILKKGNRIQSIEVLYESESIISSSIKNIVWMPEQSLIVQNSFTSLWSQPKEMEIKWTYVKK